MEESANDEQMVVVVVVKEAAKMASSPLLSVPTELFLAVVEAIDDAASLRSFALTFLYRAVLVTTGSQALSLAKALKQQRVRARATDTTGRGDDTAARAVDREPVRELRPRALQGAPPRREALTQGYRALFLDAQCGAGLQNLQSLTIHWSGDDSYFWLLTEFKPILTLPALQSLTVSCAVLGDDLADGLDAFASTTALTHLELVECFASQKALTAVLALPRALRSCHLGIMRYHTSRSNNYHEASPEQQLEALRQQRHSLQQLTWFDKDFAFDKDVRRVSSAPGAGLYNFIELHVVTLDGASALLFSILLSEWAPPNLDRLHHPTDSVDYTRIPGIPPPFALHQYLPKLHHLDLVFLPENRWNIEPLWAKPDRRDHVKRLGEDYHDRGIGLAIFTAQRGRFIPPYLFGEEVPCEEPAYRAENAWFCSCCLE
ncbi:hypothetical protein B0H14DRAFT_3892964 [Mycena olivaceomarginata]|nr:hypothetical protein B0H14DRAFT_3892964 [Mycena olivaceomarginata]